MNIKSILEKYNTIAVYGMSQHFYKTAYTVPKFMLNQGYNIIPINPNANEIAGKKVYRSLLDIPDKVEILNVFRPSDEAVKVVQESIERKKLKGDIDVIWLQEGIENEKAKQLALENNIVFIQDKCIYKEYINNF